MKPKRPLVKLLFLAALLCKALAGTVQAGYAAEAASALPIIERLDTRDLIFKQYLQDVESSRRALFSRQGNLPDREKAEALTASMTIYGYVTKGDDELLGIAARCNIPYDTLASLNRISHGEDMAAGKLLLLPSIPGIFIPEKPATDLEKLLFTTRMETGSESEPEGVILSIPRDGKTELFRFIPGDNFTATERVFFLNRGFHYPLEHFTVTSFYGPRTNPVTGKYGMHAGLDLAAPEGSEVYAVKDGTVIGTGVDPILGNYILISHENNWVSCYGHLSSINVSLHAEVQSGSLIGRVGTTGQSTGPHLHFELKQNGQSRDPAKLLGIFKGNTER